MIASKIRELIAQSGQPLVEIERYTKLSADTIKRFLDGKQTLTLENAEKLLAHFKAGVQIDMPTRGMGAPESAPVPRPLLVQLSDAAREFGLAVPATNGHFVTVEGWETRSVKLQVLRRARRDSTVLAVGAAFDSGDRAKNHRNGEFYEAIVRVNRPDFSIERFPEWKVNAYVTTVCPVPADPLEIASYLKEVARRIRWFHDMRIPRQSSGSDMSPSTDGSKPNA